MQKTQPKSAPPKPRSEIVHTQITRLPHLNLTRRLVRFILRSLTRLLVWLFTRIEVHGMENMPRQGPILVVTNHLGDADLVIGVAATPRVVDVMAKADLYDLPILGWLMDAYGVIWVHRGQPDRKALRAALQGLADGRVIIIAPEGRESVTGALEEGTHGAAFLALSAKVPILPATLTGTENSRIFGNMKRLHRTRVNLTIGKPFYLPEGPGEDQKDAEIHQLSGRQRAIQLGTQVIMKTLANQLPPEYRGVYE